MRWNLLTILLCLIQGVCHAQTLNWPFEVYLDESLVGSHRFTLSDQGERRRLESHAQFDIRFLGIDVYRYQHDSLESWRQDCLEEIHAKTNDNGTSVNVDGGRQTQDFSLKVDGKTSTLPTCIMTFAYWNPQMLRQSQLLNPQTGELTPVTIQQVGRESMQVRGVDTPVDHYHLASQKFDIDLWYDPNGNWVALDSLVEGTRKLRYRLSKS